MMKSSTMRKIKARQNSPKVQGNAGIGRAGAQRRPTKTMLEVGIHNSRWNTGTLPKGANRKTNGFIGSQRTGR